MSHRRRAWRAHQGHFQSHLWQIQSGSEEVSIFKDGEDSVGWGEIRTRFRHVKCELPIDRLGRGG